MLRPYQRRAADFLKERKSCNLWLDMGLGKTLSVLTAIAELPREPVLVVAPKKVAESVWSQEITKWNIKLTWQLCLGSASQRQKALKQIADVTIINRENLLWLIEQMGSWPWKWVVLDESDSFKDPTTKRFKALRALRKNGLVQNVTCLTGTPAPNGYLNLWSQQFLVDQGKRLGTTKANYELSYFSPGARNGHIVYTWTLKPGAKEMIQAKLKDCTISMKSEDYLDLPDMLVNDVPVQLSDKELKTYKSYEETAVLQVAGEGTYTATTAATLANKLMQWTSGFQYGDQLLGSQTTRLNEHKLDMLEEIIEANQGKNILLFYWFQEDEARLLERFKARKLKDAKDVEAWNRKTVPLMIAHPASAGHGLNLQEGGNTCVWYSLPFSLSMYQQANKRLHRSGQKEVVTIHRLIMKGTIDERIAKVLETKGANQDDLIRAVRA